MSDLIYLFGNDNDEIISSKSVNSFHKDCDIVTNGKTIQRPNTLKTKRELYKNAFTPKPLKSDNIFKFSNFPWTPTNLSFKHFDSSSFAMNNNSFSCTNLSSLPYELPPENADGNVEYKRQLLNLTPLRLQHLITQLKWRLAEGEGEAIYEIGVDDNGKVTGLEPVELMESVTNLYKMAETLNASISVLRECHVGSRQALEILIRNVPTHFSTRETRVAVLGNMDAGKSTLIGVLAQGVLDNGQGKTRLATFRHVHEVRSGRTSSISCQLLGFDKDHNLFNFYWQKNRLHQRSHEEVVLSSSKLVTLIDLAGYHKYQRTTLFALTARRPHLVLLVIPANHGFKGTSIEHLHLAITFGVPIAVVVTKIDRCQPDQAINQLSSSLTARSVYSHISIISSILEAKQAANNMSTKKCIPVFPVSCVTGSGIDILTAFLGTLQSTEQLSKHHNAEIWIDQMHYEVPRVDGCVVGGLVYTGHVHENDCLYLGPQKDGEFISVSIQSIHRNRMRQTTVENGQYASFAVSLSDKFSDEKIMMHNYDNKIKWIPQSPCSPVDETDNCVRRGMVLLGSLPDSNVNYLYKYLSEDNSLNGEVVWGIVVKNIRMLGGQELSITDLQKQQGSWIVHCGNVYQKCDILEFDNLSNLFTSSFNKNSLNNNIIFNFKLFPQFIHGNCPVVFHRAGHNVKAYGNINMLLGKDAFQKKDSKECIRMSHIYYNSKSKKLINNNSDDEYSDEYVTAPSSPILFQ